MSSRYQNISLTKSNTGSTSTSGKDMYVPIYYPNIEAKEDDTYIIVGNTDRLDVIAYDFYGDSTLWWVIAMANNLEGDSMFPPQGMYLRVPANLPELLQHYNQSNNI
jgi:hypothetical protein